MFGLDNVLGGGGGLLGGLLGGQGGLLGTIGGIAGSFFGGPIGGMIGSELGNMLQDAIGGSIKDATKTLQREDGMPGFLADQIGDQVDQVLGGMRNPDVDGATSEHCQDKFGGVMKNFQDDLTKTILDIVRSQMGGKDEEGNGKCGGKKSSGSWMQAIAKAMGQVIGEKASKMVTLSNEISQLSSGKNGKKEGAGEGAGEAGADVDTNNDSQADQAAQAQQKNTEFQATSQEFNLLSTTFSTAMKALGESMASIARKQ